MRHVYVKKNIPHFLNHFLRNLIEKNTIDAFQEQLKVLSLISVNGSVKICDIFQDLQAHRKAYTNADYWTFTAFLRIETSRRKLYRKNKI